MPERAARGGEDSTAIKSAASEGLQAYADNLGPLGVRGLLGAYGGDSVANRHALARDLAELTGTKEASQYRSIGKWLNYEQGKPGEQRNALRNKATQGHFRGLMANKRPPENAAIQISGSICYSNTCRDRTVNINTSEYPIDLGAMLEALAQGDTSGAYQEMFSNYAPAMRVEPGADVTIQFF